MNIYTLSREIYIRKSLPEVFSFFDRPENLTVITPADLGFKILTPPPIKMKVGSIIDYLISVSGVRFHWKTLITTYDPPYCFVDEQLKGPYALWHHRHTFSEYNEGTLMNDLVHYALPFGLVGNLTHTVFVKRQIDKIFDYQTKAISDLFSK